MFVLRFVIQNYIIIVWREENIRLISARLANKDEKEAYYENKKRKK